MHDASFLLSSAARISFTGLPVPTYLRRRHSLNWTRLRTVKMIFILSPSSSNVVWQSVEYIANWVVRWRRQGLIVRSAACGSKKGTETSQTHASNNHRQTDGRTRIRTGGPVSLPSPRHGLGLPIEGFSYISRPISSSRIPTQMICTYDYQHVYISGLFAGRACAKPVPRLSTAASVHTARSVLPEMKCNIWSRNAFRSATVDRKNKWSNPSTGESDVHRNNFISPILFCWCNV